MFICTHIRFIDKQGHVTYIIYEMLVHGMWAMSAIANRSSAIGDTYSLHSIWFEQLIKMYVMPDFNTLTFIYCYSIMSFIVMH